MIVGKVVGSVIATRKSEKLIGNKFMIVQPLETMKSDTNQHDFSFLLFRFHSFVITIRL